MIGGIVVALIASILLLLLGAVEIGARWAGPVWRFLQAGWQQVERRPRDWW